MKNIERKNQYDKEWAQKNPMRRRKIALDYYYRNREILNNKVKKEAHGKRELIRLEKIKRAKCDMCSLECTDDTWMMFDFDHINQDEKFKAISQMYSFPIERIVEEMDKCRLLCSNCHRFITHWEGHRQFRKNADCTTETEQQQLEL